MKNNNLIRIILNIVLIVQLICFLNYFIAIWRKTDIVIGLVRILCVILTLYAINSKASKKGFIVLISYIVGMLAICLDMFIIEFLCSSGDVGMSRGFLGYMLNYENKYMVYYVFYILILLVYIIYCVVASKKTDVKPIQNIIINVVMFVVISVLMYMLKIHWIYLLGTTSENLIWYQIGCLFITMCNYDTYLFLKQLERRDGDSNN